MKESNQSKRIKNNVNHVFNWSVLDNAPKNMFQQKNSRGVLHCYRKDYP